MAIGYFDHTAAWYRQRPQLRSAQTVAEAWKGDKPAATVILYNDIPAMTKRGTGGNADVQELARRIESRRDDIAGYLDTANRNGNVKVLLQLPPDLVSSWATNPAARQPLQKFIAEWSQYPALAGFYLFDEPERHRIPARTLQDVLKLIKQHAPDGRNTAAVSVAYAGRREMNPAIREYATASPRAFDVMLVNRYPVYRKYALAGAARSDSMNAKLGLTGGKAEREKLADNEFANLEDYYDSIATVASLPGLDGRPAYASVQAYGLRDDCDGPECKAIKENNARRSPTWNELVYLVTSAWMSGADGTIFYARYLSLFDQALRKRLDNLESLIGRVFARLPACALEVAVRDAPSRGAQTAGAPKGLLAHYAASSNAGRPDYLVVMHRGTNRAAARVELDAKLGIASADELQFNAQGNAVDPQRRQVERSSGKPGLRVTVDGPGVRIFKLNYE
jgi:hypothetical protein